MEKKTAQHIYAAFNNKSPQRLKAWLHDITQHQQTVSAAQEQIKIQTTVMCISPL